MGRESAARRDSKDVRVEVNKEATRKRTFVYCYWMVDRSSFARYKMIVKSVVFDKQLYVYERVCVSRMVDGYRSICADMCEGFQEDAQLMTRFFLLR